MKKTQQSKKEIYLIVYVFISIVLLAMISKTFSFYQMHDINEKSVETYQYALNVSNSALSIKADIYKIHRDMKDIVLTDSNEELLKLIKEMEITQKSVYSSFDIIEKNIATKYGLTLLKETKDMFEHCQSVRDAIISLINSNSIAQAIEIAKDSEPRHMQKLESCVSNLYDYAYNRAAYLKTVSDENFKKMLIMDFLTALLLLFLFFSIVYYTIKRISKYIYKNEHLRGVLAVIRDVNQLIVREKNRDKLIKESCDILVSNHVFESAWIVLYDDFKLAKYIYITDRSNNAELFKEKIMSGWAAHCIEKTGNDSCSFIENTSEQCLECPLKDTYNGKCAFNVELKHKEKFFGYLTLRIDKKNFEYSDEIDLLKEVTGDIAYALYNLEVEQDIAELKELYDNTINSLENLLFVKDKNFIYVTCNGAFERFVGKSKSKIIGKSDYDIIDKESADLFRSYDENILKSKIPKSNYEWVTYLDGKKVYLLTTKSPLLNSYGEIIGLVGNSVDMTKEKKSEEALIESEKRFKQLMKESPSVIEVYDADGLQIDVNHAYEVLWQIPVTRTLHKFNLFKSKEVEKKGLLKYIKRAYDGESVALPLYEYDPRGETEAQGKGRTRTLNTRIYPLKDSKGNVKNIVILHEDVTEREKLFLELKEKNELVIAQSRHAAMGEMIGMIAHQWRQPISIVSMIANNILLDSALGNFDETKAEHYSKDILEQTEHLSKTIDDFRNFFKPDKSISKINLKSVIDEVYSIVKDSLKNNSIRFEASYNSDVEVDGYQRELMQVFINIINNAKDALVSNKTEDALIEVNVYEDEKYVNIKIYDNAGEIKSEVIQKIFDPYFTTKDEKIGTGLGLYISKIIVEEHLRGKLEVQNSKHGVSFIVKLPKIRVENNAK